MLPVVAVPWSVAMSSFTDDGVAVVVVAVVLCLAPMEAPLVSGNVRTVPATTNVVAMSIPPSARLDVAETRNGVMAPATRATALTNPCPVALISVGNSSGVMIHVTQLELMRKSRATKASTCKPHSGIISGRVEQMHRSPTLIPPNK